MRGNSLISYPGTNTHHNIGGALDLDYIATISLVCSWLIVTTTIQAQDFADIYGDRLSGRLTFPMVAPEVSRICTLLALIVWSIFLSYFWGIGPFSSFLFCGCGTYTGLRYYRHRLVKDDEHSYVLYNVSQSLFKPVICPSCIPQKKSSGYCSLISCLYTSGGEFCRFKNSVTISQHRIRVCA